MIKFKLKFKEDIESDYRGLYSNIDREIFDRIIALDTSAKGNQLGNFAKNLLLRCYLAGETDFLDKGDAVTKAINKFLREIRTSKDVPGILKNPSNYPSVDSFINYVNDPTNTTVDVVTTAPTEQPKESKLDITFKQYYANKLDRETFDKLISCDPDTSANNSIGNTAKNFIIPQYINADAAGKKYILDHLDDIPDAIRSYDSNRKNLNTTHQDLKGFSSVEEFINITTAGEQSDLLTYLKACPAWADCGYIGSTWQYDVFMPKTVTGAAYIAGAANDPNMPGYRVTPNTEGFRDFSYGRGSYSYGSNRYGHWCTSGVSWQSYRGTGNEGKFFDFMAKGSALWENGRVANCQIAILPNGRIYQSATGEERVDSSGGSYFDKLIGKDPQILEICGNFKGGYIQNIPAVVNYITSKQYKDRPFIYEGPKTINDLYNQYSKTVVDSIKKIVREVIVQDGVTTIEPATFMGWTSLSKVTFPASLERISAEAFKGCSSLQLLTLPNNLKRIGGQAFAFCDKLHGTVKLPTSLKYIGDKAFYKTDVKLSIYANTPEGSIEIAPEDWDWYAKNAKIIPANESLDNLEEAVLDEKLPRDLATAYEKHNSDRNSHHQHDMSQGTNKKIRRGATYDYEAATYTPISVDQAVNNVRANPASSSKIRALYGDDYLELEQRNNGKVYPIHAPDRIGEYSLDNIRHQVQTIPGLRRILSLADKIYWTDEYDHAFGAEYTQNRSQRNASTTTGINGLTRATHPDTGAHSAADPWKIRRQGSIYSFNPGEREVVNAEGINEGEMFRQLRDYIGSYKQKNIIHKQAQKVRKVLNSITANADMYDEEDLNTYTEALRLKLDELQRSYMDLLNKYNNSKATFEQMFDAAFVESLEARREELRDIDERLTEKETQLRDCQNKLAEYRNKSITKTDEFQDINNHVQECQDNIAELQEQKEEAQTAIQQAEAEILRLQTLIAQNKILIQDIDDEQLPEAFAQLEEARDNVDNAIEELSSNMSAQMRELEQTILETQQWFNEHQFPGHEKSKSFSIANKPEMKPEVAAKLSKKGANDSEETSEEEPTEETEDAAESTTEGFEDLEEL